MVLRLIGVLVAVILATNARAAQPAELAQAAALPACNALGYHDSLALHPDAFGAADFELAIDDYRGWVKRKIKTYVSLAKRGHARKRKRSKGTLTVRTSQGVACTIRAKFRAHGDLADHYPGDLNEQPSLNVHLVDGHVFGITKFILFRPETRNGDNEVFAATLVGQLGFLSPRTSMGTLRVAGSERLPVRVIFQEKIVKEFLEANHVREGPIVEGDERFAFGDRYAHLKRGAALARISNAKWAAKGPTSMTIAEDALGRMNRLLYRYDKSWATIHGSNMVDMVELAKRLDGDDSPLKFNDYPAFEAIVFSMGGTHGFSQDDRRAVYDPLTGSFTPIYYDAGASILTKPDAPLDRNITLSAQKNIPAALERLESLDIARLHAALAVRDVKLPADRVQAAIDRMKRRLGEMAVSTDVEPVAIKPRWIYGRDGNGISHVFPSGRDKLEICSGSLDACSTVARSLELQTSLLAQEWADPQGYPAIYFAFPRSELDKPFSGFIDPAADDIRRQSRIVDGFRLELVGDIDAAVDEDRRSISLLRFGASGRAVISTGELRGWSVVLDDRSGHVKNEAAGEQNFDRFGLTGCLTIADIAVADLDLRVTGATCEDAVNFVRVTGEVRSTIVRDAAFDAVDADFSRMGFGRIEVGNAGNDCLDLSYGDYRASVLELVRCGDKGVSVGESSRATIGNVVARHVTIGLAAKDFGTIELESGTIEDSAKCYDLYNKKQEFSGGFLAVRSGRLDCRGVSGTVGPTSRLDATGRISALGGTKAGAVGTR